jgi:hypothetical protein
VRAREEGWTSGWSQLALSRQVCPAVTDRQWQLKGRGVPITEFYYRMLDRSYDFVFLLRWSVGSERGATGNGAWSGTYALHLSYPFTVEFQLCSSLLHVKTAGRRGDSSPAQHHSPSHAFGIKPLVGRKQRPLNAADVIIIAKGNA